MKVKMIAGQFLPKSWTRSKAIVNIAKIHNELLAVKGPQVSGQKYAMGDFKNASPVKWCPGCGDYAVLNALHKAMAEIGVSPKDTAVISGIGCSSRLFTI